MKAFTDSLTREVEKSEHALLRIKASIKGASYTNRDEFKEKLAREKAYTKFFKLVQSECHLLGERHGVTIKALSLVHDQFVTINVEQCPGTTEARGKLLKLVINYLIR